MECFAGCLFVLRKRKAVYRGDDRSMRWIKGSLISLPRLPWRYNILVVIFVEKE